MSPFPEVQSFFSLQSDYDLSPIVACLYLNFPSFSLLVMLNLFQLYIFITWADPNRDQVVLTSDVLLGFPSSTTTVRTRLSPVRPSYHPPARSSRVRAHEQ